MQLLPRYMHRLQTHIAIKDMTWPKYHSSKKVQAERVRVGGEKRWRLISFNGREGGN